MDINLKKIKELLDVSHKIAIFGHLNPDGDCIGAMLGLGRLLEKQRKKVKYFVPNTPSKLFNFLKEIKKLKHKFDYKKYDCLICVDFTGLDRTGIIYQANPEYFIDKKIIIIDHHIGDNKESNTIQIKDISSISTCEILFELTYKWRSKLYDKKIATYFYLGLTTDSGNFLFGENHEKIFTHALHLIQLGADKNFIVNNIIRKKSLNSIKFLQLLLNRIQQKGELLYTYYDEKELDVYDIDQEEASYALHIIQNIDGPKVVLLLRKIGLSIRGSLRAKEDKKYLIDCNKIAHSFGGGGHKLAAGFSIPIQGTFEEQIKYITNNIQKKIKQHL